MLFQGKMMETDQIDRTDHTKDKDKREDTMDYKNKKERIHSQKLLPAMLPPKRRTGGFPEKAFLCTSLKKIRQASLAVETALVLPLFFLGVLSLISFMDLYRVQTEHLTKLCERAKETGMYAYALDGSGVEEITLPDAYSYQPISSVIPLPKVYMVNTVKVHAWIGREHTAFGEGEAHETEPMVYLTENGSVYHKDLNCSHLNLSVTEISGSSVSSRRNAYGEKYHACESCSQGQKPAGTVYVTEKGNRYHNSASCSGLKRTVRLVKESEAGDVHACSRCG